MKTIEDIIDNLCVMTVKELLLLSINIMEELNKRHNKFNDTKERV